MRVDSHQHFWNYSAEEYDWIDDSMAIIRRDFLPPDLKIEFDKHRQRFSSRSSSLYTEETRWLLDFADNTIMLPALLAGLTSKLMILKNSQGV